jgi:hypothetical protein
MSVGVVKMLLVVLRRESKVVVWEVLKTLWFTRLGYVSYSFLYFEIALCTHCLEYFVVIRRAFLLAFEAMQAKEAIQSLYG